MLKEKPAIAVRRREEALRKFSHKLRTLEEMIDAGKFDQLPKRMLPTTFAAWEDKELGVKRISRNLLYGTAEQYTILHRKMDSLLQTLAKSREKGTRREDISKKLVEKLEAAERRAQTYVNDYEIVKVELEDKIEEIARLEQQLVRLREKNRRVTPLQAVRTTNEMRE